MRGPVLVLSVATVLVPLTGCCSEPAGGAGPASSTLGTASARGKLEGVTADTMADAAKKEGFTVREEATERDELPGVTIFRLTLDHKSKGTAFVDLYDLTDVSAHNAKPAVTVGTNKTLYVSVSGSPVTSDALLAALVDKTPIDGMNRAAIEGFFKSEGWKLGDSSKFKDDISGQSIVDVAASKEDTEVMVFLLDYARVAGGKEQSAMLRDGQRLLFVDMEKRRWSKSLLEQLVK